MSTELSVGSKHSLLTLNQIINALLKLRLVLEDLNVEKIHYMEIDTSTHMIQIIDNNFSEKAEAFNKIISETTFPFIFCKQSVMSWTLLFTTNEYNINNVRFALQQVKNKFPEL